MTTSSVAAALAHAVKHRPPAVARWGEPLFFEAMVATPLDRLEVMLRLGRRAPYQAVELTQRKDRYYAGEFALGPAAERRGDPVLPRRDQGRCARRAAQRPGGASDAQARDRAQDGPHQTGGS